MGFINSWLKDIGLVDSLINNREGILITFILLNVGIIILSIFEWSSFEDKRSQDFKKMWNEKSFEKDLKKHINEMSEEYKQKMGKWRYLQKKQINLKP